MSPRARSPRVEPITVESARGATVTATDGTEYTDLYSGIGVVNAGHVPPKVAEAAKRQMDKIVHSCSYVYHVPVVADLAERLAQVTPGRLQKTFFGNSGAEAVEGALRLARVFTRAPRDHRAAGLVSRPHCRCARRHRQRVAQASRRRADRRDRIRSDAESVSLPDVLGLMLAGVRRRGRRRHPLRHE